MGYGAVDVRMDWGAALQVALAEGCDQRAAGELLRAIADGMAKAQADKQRNET
jgi:hypothetical protein